MNESVWSTIGAQILTGITIGVSSGVILALGQYIRSRWQHRNAIKSFRARIEQAQRETSIEKCQRIVDEQPEALREARPDVTAEAWQYRIVESELEALRIKLLHEGVQLDPEERASLERGIVGFSRVLDTLFPAGGTKIPPSSMYDRFWDQLKGDGWLD